MAQGSNGVLQRWLSLLVPIASSGSSESLLPLVALADANGNVVPTETAAEWESGLSSVDDDGSTAAGLKMASFKNVGAADGDLAGGTLPVGETVTFYAPPGGTLAAIPYDATGTQYLVAVLTA